MGRLQHRTAPGCTYFVTTKTWQNRSVFQVKENAGTLVQCRLHYRDQGVYRLHEFVVMPKHLHVLLTPSIETSLEKAMQLIKGGSSHRIHRQREKSGLIWNSGFHEVTVRDAEDFEARRRYIHTNPIEARLVERAADWPWSSASGKFALDVMGSSGAKALVADGGNVGANPTA